MTVVAVPREILLIEENSTDVEFVRQALSLVGARLVLHVIRDGADALKYLDDEVVLANMTRPALVILDLEVPRRSGFEVLSRIKDDPALRVIPTVVLTGSSEETDIWRAYDAHANAYLVKPESAQDYMTVLQRLLEFYLLSAKLPGSKPLESLRVRQPDSLDDR